MSGPKTWHGQNQRHLAAVIAGMRARLEEKLGTDAASRLSQAEEDRAKARSAMTAPPALEVVAGAYRLSGFERELLALVAAAAIDDQVGRLCAQLHADDRARFVSFGIALSVLDDPHWSAIVPDRPLRSGRFIRVGSGQLAAAPLDIDERILHMLLGASRLDVRLEPSARLMAAPAALPGSHEEVAQDLASAWTRSDQPSRLIQLRGADPDDLTLVAARAGALAGLPMYLVRSADLPPDVAGRDEMCRLWNREQALDGAGLVLRSDLDAAPVERRVAAELAGRIGGVTAYIGDGALPAARRTLVRRVPRLTAPEQHALWTSALGRRAKIVTAAVGTVVDHFDLGTSAIVATAADVTASNKKTAGIAGALWTACREATRPALTSLAQHIFSPAGWDDLVLPEAQKDTLESIVRHVRHRATVHEGWGFAAKTSRGLGVTALFAGPSGTGKTMSAEVIANALDLDLFRIDLSAVVDKYIGETEKHLRTIFDIADRGSVVLLFDEADALFGRRSEVRDSHDRYANIEVSYLLQRMEEYRGLAILTTNQRHALDPAFARRIRFAVNYPFPDEVHRTAMWTRAFPAACQTDGLDPARLARLELSGSSIASVALNAAFEAAANGGVVGIDEVRAAAMREYRKLEKPITETEARALV